MIEIEVFYHENFFQKLIVQGHASEIFGKKGKNTLCAAVSVLTQTLYLHYKQNGFIQTESIKDGYLEFSLNNQNSETNLSFETIHIGLKNIQIQYPNEIKLIYFTKENSYGT